MLNFEVEKEKNMQIDSKSHNYVPSSSVYNLLNRYILIDISLNVSSIMTGYTFQMKKQHFHII